jgi:hypothetical protein
LNDEPRQNQQDEATLRYGDISVAAKGSIVVLVILLVGSTAANFWLAHHIQAHLVEQDTIMTKVYDEFLRAEGVFAAKHDATVQQIQSNRLYLREIERLCVMTNDQRMRMQNQLSEYMKELLQIPLQPLRESEKHQ